MHEASTFKIFVASSGELKVEREKTIPILHTLGKTFAPIHLEAVEWETDLPSGSIKKQRFQDEINPLLDSCQVVLVLVYSKIGEYTMEEYRLARAKNKKVFLYFKTGFSPRNKTEMAAYDKVLDFRQEVEKENQLLFKEYENLDQFEKLLHQDLSLYLGQSKAATHSLLETLRKGSLDFYQKLHGPNGRFKHLHISELILPGTKLDWLPTSATVNTSTKTEAVSQVLASLWPEKIRHAVLLGDGGMGKTVNLVLWWQKLLEQIDITGPIPLYLALNELNQLPPEARHHFILYYIKKNYANASLTLEQLRETLSHDSLSSQSPAFILLLDGFNEITVEKQQLLVEIKWLREACPGIQLVLTSRYDMREQCQWLDWNLVTLTPLAEEQIQSYLPHNNILLPTLKTLLGNPMMLTLYVATCDVQREFKDSNLYRFKPRVESPAELLWNFMEAQVAKLPERLGHDEQEISYYTFLLRFLLPALGFEMEKAGLFDFTREQMNEVLERVCQSFVSTEFFALFPEFLKHRKLLPVGGCVDPLDSMERAEHLKYILCQTLAMMVEEGQSLRFLHQNFRDFFAAVAVWNQMKIGLYKKEIPVGLKDRCLDFFVRRMVGELAEEFRLVPRVVPGKGWSYPSEPHTLLSEMLDLCRGLFGERDSEKVGYAIWNILTIWKESRGELSGMDLSKLDLTGFIFNEVRCSRYSDGHYLAADFNGSRIHEKNLLPQGHSNRVTRAVYIENGKKILSASLDNTIKEWDVATGACLSTLIGHASTVTSAVYSYDGKKILSASFDNTIKEWDVTTGACISTLIGHTSTVTSAVYSYDGKKILSASWDSTIKEWDAATGACLTTLTGHSEGITSTVYSYDGKKILSASWDNTIKEWDVASGACLTTLFGHSDGVNSAVYNKNGKKILSASDDQTIKEWDVASGVCLTTLTGHSDGVTSAMYSDNENKILSASWDNTIKEWDVVSGTCLSTLTGHSSTITSTMYSNDGKKILSTSLDNTIREWDVTSGACLSILTGHASYVTCAVYSENGKKILSTSYDKTIREWDATCGVCLSTLTGHFNMVTNAVYSPDGKKILSASYDNTIKEWDMATGACLSTLTGHAEGVTSAVYSENGKKILSTSDDNTIKEWDVTSKTCLKTHNKDDNPSFPDYPPMDAPKKIKTGYNTIYIPDPNNKKQKKELLNIPGLWIQGCSFDNLEAGSQWTEKGWAILKMYGGKTGR